MTSISEIFSNAWLLSFSCLLPSIFGFTYLILFSTSSHGCLWVWNISRKGTFTDRGFRCMYNRNQGCRSRLRISLRAQNIAFAFMVKADRRVHLSMPMIKVKGFPVVDMDLSTNAQSPCTRVHRQNGFVSSSISLLVVSPLPIRPYFLCELGVSTWNMVKNSKGGR